LVLVQKLPAGHKLPSNNGGYVNMGEVPIGTVRFNVVDQDGGKWVSELVSYKFGE
jgi:hypothetical protein